MAVLTGIFKVPLKVDAMLFERLSAEPTAIAQAFRADQFHDTLISGDAEARAPTGFRTSPRREPDR
jgi:hypothetical protein